MILHFRRSLFLVPCSIFNSKFSIQTWIVEGIPLAHIPGLVSFFKPKHSLCRGPMGKSIRNNTALGFLLQPVIAYGVGGIQGFFNIAAFKDIFHFLSMMSPNAGQEIGL